MGLFHHHKHKKTDTAGTVAPGSVSQVPTTTVDPSSTTVSTTTNAAPLSATEGGSVQTAFYTATQSSMADQINGVAPPSTTTMAASESGVRVVYASSQKEVQNFNNKANSTYRMEVEHSSLLGCHHFTPDFHHADQGDVFGPRYNGVSFTETNPGNGIEVRTSNHWAVGALNFINSFNKETDFSYASYDAGKLPLLGVRLSLKAGLTTRGYEPLTGHHVNPLGAIDLSKDIPGTHGRAAAHLMIMPPLEGVGVAAVGVTTKIDGKSSFEVSADPTFKTFKAGANFTF